MLQLTYADKALVYNELFHSVYTHSSSTLPDMNTITSDVEPLQPFEISELDVYIALIKLDPNKALGTNSISPKVLKYCAESWVVVNFLNLVYPPVLYLLNGRFIELFLYSN